MSLRRPQGAVPPGGVDLSKSDGLEMEFLALFEFLSLPTWDDGSVRVPGSVTLFTEDGTWKACVNDKDGGMVAFVSSTTPTGLFRAIADGVESGRLDWRKSKPGRGGKPARGA